MPAIILLLFTTFSLISFQPAFAKYNKATKTYKNAILGCRSNNKARFHKNCFDDETFENDILPTIKRGVKLIFLFKTDLRAPYLPCYNKLRYLHLTGNNVSDLSSICFPESLRVLDVQATYLNEGLTNIKGKLDTEDLRFLSTKEHLTYLNLQDHQIKALPDLSGMESLTDLNLMENPIETLEPGFQFPPNLKYFTFGGNSVSLLDLIELPEILTGLYIKNFESSSTLLFDAPKKLRAFSLFNANSNLVNVVIDFTKSELTEYSLINIFSNNGIRNFTGTKLPKKINKLRITNCTLNSEILATLDFSLLERANIINIGNLDVDGIRKPNRYLNFTDMDFPADVKIFKLQNLAVTDTYIGGSDNPETNTDFASLKLPAKLEKLYLNNNNLSTLNITNLVVPQSVKMMDLRGQNFDSRPGTRKKIRQHFKGTNPKMKLKMDKPKR
jgi:hypothetical protein